ncbi:MAG: hypothetical protein V7637_2654, partial [Mycobacteriales bacterium]
SGVGRRAPSAASEWRQEVDDRAGGKLPVALVAADADAVYQQAADRDHPLDVVPAGDEREQVADGFGLDGFLRATGRRPRAGPVPDCDHGVILHPPGRAAAGPRTGSRPADTLVVAPQR